MQVTIFKNRKPTDEVHELAAIQNGSLEALIKSLGEERVKTYVENGLKAAFTSAHSMQVGKGKTPAEISAWAKTWTPQRAARSRKTPEQKVLALAEKLGLSPAQLSKMASVSK